MPNEIHKQFSQNGENSQLILLGITFMSVFHLKGVVSGENNFEGMFNIIIYNQHKKQR